MIAKLVAHGATREAALASLAEACAAVSVWPVRTNAGFLGRLLARDDVVAGALDTGVIERAGKALTAKPAPTPAVLAAAARARLQAAAEGGRTSPWTALGGFRVNGAPSTSVRLAYNGAILELEAAGSETSTEAPAVRDGERLVVFADGEAYAFTDPAPAGGADVQAGDGQILAPMPGRIAAVEVAPGDAVRRGQTLVTLEAMKMEQALTAHFDAKVAEVRCAVGDQVTEGALLVRLSAAG
jgi:acetyl/propionyl-CoA carboxylase alpha subunit